jgi:pentatricopeptide repeat protein
MSTLMQTETNLQEDSKKRQAEGLDREDVLSDRPIPRKPSKSKPSKEVIALRRSIQICCRDNDLAQAMDIYLNATKEQILLEPQSLYSLINLCDGLGDRPLHIGTPKLPKDNDVSNKLLIRTETKPRIEIDTASRYELAFQIKKYMEDRKLPLNENAYTALIRMLSKSNRLEEADQLLREAEHTQQCKPKAYCDGGCLDRAIDVWVRLDQYKLSLTEKEYISLMRCALKAGSIKLMERVLSELAEDILVPSKLAINTLVAWFQSPHSMMTHPNEEINGDTIHFPPTCAPTMGPVVTQNNGKSMPWKIDFGCSIKDGILQTACLAGVALKPVPLSSDAWQSMLKYNQSIVLQGGVDGHESQYQGGGKGLKVRKINVTAREVYWNQFQAFLDQTYPQGLDIVIDGANVGYYKQNFPNAPRHIDYRQVDQVIQHFLDLGKTVLVILHSRHFAPNLMPEWAVPIVKKWDDNIYQANPGMNDDWFWLHAALWGKRTLVVTNDEMRDHHFQMLETRSFVRWKERHQIHFAFPVTLEGIRTLELIFPKKYSRRVQSVGGGLVIPLTKRGDENRFLDGTHIAMDDEPDEETYLCICPQV